MNNNMKKLLFSLLIMALIFAFFGCGKTGADNGSKGTMEEVPESSVVNVIKDASQWKDGPGGSKRIMIAKGDAGAIDGPMVTFKMDLNTNEILEKEFEPAPEFQNPEQAEFSGEVLEIPDERLVEIGLYFKGIFDPYL